MRKYKRLLAGVLITTLLSSVPFSSYAGWIKSDTVPAQAGVSSWWYSTTAANDAWYAGAPVLWQWLDGNKDGIAECYAFNEAGWMYAGTTTPDGYTVNADGAWVIDGMIQTKQVTAATARRSGSGGGGGGGRGSSGSGNSKPGIKPPDPQPEVPEEPKPEPPKVEVITYSYTVLYKDIDSRAVLRQEVGQAEKDSIIEIEHPYFDDYMVCDKQPESFQLSYNNLKEIVYYRKVAEASPSDAEEIRWEVNFVDAESHQKEILPKRSGVIVTGGSLYVNYMETVTIDGVIWSALETPPFETEVFGPGDEIYYIEFVETDTVPEPEDPYAKERELLNEWLLTAKEADGAITGEVPGTIPDSRFIITNKTQNDARIRSIMNSIPDVEPYTFYIIGKNYIPNGLAIAEWFGGNADYSIILEETIVIDKENYSIVRINLSLSPDTDNCHHWVLTVENQATCLSKGSQIYECENCGEEIEAYLPAFGHSDDDGDTICDICGEFVGIGEPARTHWNLGDIQVQELDGEIYFFKCIDLNYSDRAENHNQMALFFSTDIVPANYGSQYKYEKLSDGTYGYVFYPGPITNFGAGNDYKYFAVRQWLNRLESDTYNLGHTSIGVSYAYMGATAEGAGEQLHESDLTASYIGNQKMTDQLFILSVDEALKYKEHLWEIEDTGAFKNGYWLRSPMGTGSQHDTGYVYIVDLVNENIRPQSVSASGTDSDEEINVTGSTGVRLAYTMPQN